MSAQFRYRFGNSVLDESTGELNINGLVVEIQPQSMRLLTMLLSYRGELVTRKELEERVWFGRPVGENVLASAITRLRNTLGDSNAGLIEAIPRIGFRINGQVERTAVGQKHDSTLALAAGQAAPGRPDYVLLTLLGQSASAEVWLAQRTGGAQRVFKYAVDAQGLASLKREASLSQVLRAELGERPDLLPILDWNFEQAPFFLETSYAGTNLLQWSAAGGLTALDRSDRLMLFTQVAGAVAAAHSVGVLHKDLKPANILVTQSTAGLQLRLADFGSGRLADEQRFAVLGMADESLMGPATLLSDEAQGSLLYIAPERLKDQPSTERSDVFALGVLLYQLLAGDMSKPMTGSWERDIDDSLLIEDISAATDGDVSHRTASVDVLLSAIANLPARRAAREQEKAEREQHAARERIAQRERARRPWLFGTIAALALSLCISLFAYAELSHQKALLQRQSANVAALNDFLTDDVLGEANPGQAGRSGVTVTEAAARAAVKIDSPSRGYTPEIRASLHAAMQRLFTGLDDFSNVLKEGDAALRVLEQAPNEPLRNLVSVYQARALQQSGREKEAEQRLAAVARWLAIQDTPPVEVAGQYWYARQSASSSAYHWAEVPALVDKARKLLAQSAHPHQAQLLQLDLISARAKNLQGDYAGAREDYTRMVEQAQQRNEQNKYPYCMALLGLTEALNSLYAKDALPTAQHALECAQSVVGPESSPASDAWYRLGQTWYHMKRWADAKAAFEHAALIRQHMYGESATRTIAARSGVARCMRRLGDAAGAQALYASLLSQASFHLTDQDAQVQMLKLNLAHTLLDQDKIEGVKALLDGVDLNVLRNINTDPMLPAQISYQHARLAILTGDRANAIRLLEQVLPAIAKGDPEQAEPSVDQVRALLDKLKVK